MSPGGLLSTGTGATVGTVVDDEPGFPDVPEAADVADPTLAVPWLVGGLAAPVPPVPEQAVATMSRPVAINGTV
jgi:hypothetical protein